MRRTRINCLSRVITPQVPHPLVGSVAHFFHQCTHGSDGVKVHSVSAVTVSEISESGMGSGGIKKPGVQAAPGAAVAPGWTGASVATCGFQHHSMPALAIPAVPIAAFLRKDLLLNLSIRLLHFYPVVKMGYTIDKKIIAKLASLSMV